MIAIVNISDADAPLCGANHYEVRINQNVICSFVHDRQPNGLAQCLRDAANAVEEMDVKKLLPRRQRSPFSMTCGEIKIIETWLLVVRSGNSHTARARAKTKLINYFGSAEAVNEYMQNREEQNASSQDQRSVCCKRN